MPKKNERGPFGFIENPKCSKVSEKLNVEHVDDKKIKKVAQRGPFRLVRVPKCIKRFWLKLGLELATAGFTLNRLTSVPKRVTYSAV